MFREKILRYVPQVDDMKRQSSITQMTLMRRNITEAIMMFMIWGWSCESWLDEWSLLLTKTETQQLLVIKIKKMNSFDKICRNLELQG